MSMLIPNTRDPVGIDVIGRLSLDDQLSWPLCGNSPPFVTDVFVSGNLAHVAYRYVGLDVFDVSDPASPSLIGGNSAFPSFPGERNLLVQDEHVFIVGPEGLTILNKYNELQINRAIVADDGRLRLRLSGATGQRVRVQRSINLREWADWQTVTFDSATLELTDDPASNVQRLRDRTAATSATHLELTDDPASNVQRFYRAVEGGSYPQHPTPP